MFDYNLILVRHGQSQWNKENRFTGWCDIDLTDQGRKEAKKAAQLLINNKFECDIAYTSFLKRCICTLWIILDSLDLLWLPVVKSWRLNERHYGALTGLNKEKTMKKYGKEQVQLWRRGYDISPPSLGNTSDQENVKDRRYQNVSIPVGESLKQTKQRVMPFWNENIAPSLKSGKKVLVVAHGNSLRALIKHIEALNDEEIMKVEIPTVVPMAYSLNDALEGNRNILTP